MAHVFICPRSSPGSTSGYVADTSAAYENQALHSKSNLSGIINLSAYLQTGSGSDQFPVSRQNSNLFGPPLSGESRADDGLFGTNPSTFNGCSIFGDPSPIQSNEQQAVTGPSEFSFSFGAKSPDDRNSTLNRPAAFSLF